MIYTRKSYWVCIDTDRYTGTYIRNNFEFKKESVDLYAKHRHIIMHMALIHEWTSLLTWSDTLHCKKVSMGVSLHLTAVAPFTDMV